MDFDIITFDCYGTLIDWEAGISGAFASQARNDGMSLERDEIIRAYHEVEPTVEAAGYRAYRDVLRDTAVGVAARLGWRLDPQRAAFLAASLPEWPEFADTNATLRRLRNQGYRLGILSNVDDDLLRSTLGRFTVEFDLLVTAEQVRSYKPAHGHFAQARQSIGDARWLHAAQSYFHDVAPASELGIPVVWVNRKAEQPAGEARPLGEVTTLAELPGWLESHGGR
jgi:2-haloacid dehalogenase/putative hydrolase of the HAD superfamily